jgi:hypothetical protein
MHMKKNTTRIRFIKVSIKIKSDLLKLGFLGEDSLVLSKVYLHVFVRQEEI